MEMIEKLVTQFILDSKKSNELCQEAVVTSSFLILLLFTLRIILTSYNLSLAPLFINEVNKILNTCISCFY